VQAPLYDEIGRTYSTTRRPDPRIAARIRAALGDARTVVNVGAGTGAYEPDDLDDVLAVEPSAAMIAQRPAGSATVINATAERLPIGDDSFDAAMAIISDHHWDDREAGLRELRRVARRRVVLLNSDPGAASHFWLTRDYLPGFVELIDEPYREAGHWEAALRRVLGEIQIEIVPVAHDCTDGFYQAYWRRPEAYLDPQVRANISVFHRVPAADVARAVQRLRNDLHSGIWQRRNAELLTRRELDVGLRLVTSDVT
jgi:ubiquinone/menaquinone biosynthesis C-methylase UbiE